MRAPIWLATRLPAPIQLKHLGERARPAQYACRTRTPYEDIRVIVMQGTLSAVCISSYILLAQIHSGANESEEHNGNRPHIRSIHCVCIVLRIYFVYKTHLSIVAVNAWARKHLRTAMPTAPKQSGFMARSAFLLRMCIPLRTKLHQTQARSAQERCFFLNSGTTKHAQERESVPRKGGGHQ